MRHPVSENIIRMGFVENHALLYKQATNTVSVNIEKCT